MRVLYFSPGWPPSDFSNGIISYLAGIIPELKKLNVESEIVSAALGPRHTGDATGLPTSTDRLSVQSLIEKVLHRFAPDRASERSRKRRLYRTAQQIARRCPIDLVEMEETFGMASAFAAGAGAPLVVRLHGPTFLNGVANGIAEDGNFRRIVEAEGRLIAQANAVSAPSRDVLDQVRAHYGLALPSAVVIPNSGPHPVADERWDASLAEPNHLLFIGRFDRHKGADIMIEAFAQVLKTHPKARLSFAGADTSGLTDDSGRHFRIDQFALDRLGDQSNRFQYLGRIPQEDLKALRRSAAVVIHPSRYENFSVAVLEACSQGVPLIVSNAGGQSEIVKDEETALLFQAGSVEALAARIRVLLDNPAMAAQLGEAALLDYGNRFLPKTIAAQTYEFYCELLARHSPTS